MTDLEKFVETYKQFGIKLHLNINPEGHTLVFLGYEGFQGDYKVTGNEKFEGYIGFHSDLVFDENGKFLSQGFWE